MSFSDNVQKSFFFLLKNNGKFKSEKQAKFLLSQTDQDNCFATATVNCNLGSDYNFKSCGSYYHIFQLDQHGVVKVDKCNSRNKITLYWERKDQATFEQIKTKQLTDKQEYTSLCNLEIRIENIIKIAKFMYLRNTLLVTNNQKAADAIKHTFVTDKANIHLDKHILRKESKRIDCLFSLLEETIEKRVNVY